jgi:hypothetical protein
MSVNNHNCRIWCSENPRGSLEYVRVSAKVNVFCAPSKERERERESVYGHFFLMEMTITGIMYPDMIPIFINNV